MSPLYYWAGSLSLNTFKLSNIDGKILSFDVIAASPSYLLSGIDTSKESLNSCNDFLSFKGLHLRCRYGVVVRYHISIGV